MEHEKVCTQSPYYLFYVLLGRKERTTVAEKRWILQGWVCAFVVTLHQEMLHVPPWLSSQVLLHLLILHKGVLVDGLHNISEGDFWSESVTVVNDWLSIWAIPTVNCQKQSFTSTTKSVWHLLILLETSDKYYFIFWDYTYTMLWSWEGCQTEK